MSWEVEESDNEFDHSRSEMFQLKDAEFVQAIDLSIPTALDYSHH